MEHAQKPDTVSKSSVENFLTRSHHFSGFEFCLWIADIIFICSYANLGELPNYSIPQIAVLASMFAGLASATYLIRKNPQRAKSILLLLVMPACVIGSLGVILAEITYTREHPYIAINPLLVLSLVLLLLVGIVEKIMRAIRRWADHVLSR